MLVRDLYTVFRNNKCSEEKDMRSYRSCNDRCESLRRDPIPLEKVCQFGLPESVSGRF